MDTTANEIREHLAAISALLDAADVPVRVTIPGYVWADIDGGGITQWKFLPSAGDAGYFGNGYSVVDGTLVPTRDEPEEDYVWAMVAQAVSMGLPIGWEG